MEYTVKIKDKKVYDAVMQFINSLKTKNSKMLLGDKENEQWSKLAQAEFLKGNHTKDSVYDSEEGGVSVLSEKQKKELDFRLEEYMQGKSKSYTWEEAMKKIKGKRR